MDPALREARHDAAEDPATSPGRRFTWSFQVRFMDLNPSGHLDNLQILRAVDEARHRLLGVREPGGPPVLSGLIDGAPIQVTMLVAAHRVEYRRELWLSSDPLELTLWVCRVGGSSFDVATEVRQSTGAPVAALAVTTVVLMDPSVGAAWALSDPIRAALAAYSGPAPAFR
jgi:acyl-CoA thioester hydrolase